MNDLIHPPPPLQKQVIKNKKLTKKRKEINRQ